MSFLVVRFSSLGDVLLTTPLLRALRTSFPEADITVATKDLYAPLFTGNPSVNRVVELKTGEDILPYAARLREHRYDLCMDLHDSLRSKALRALVPGKWQGFSKGRIARGVMIATGLSLYGKTRSMAERYFEASRGLKVRPDGQPPEVFLSVEEETGLHEEIGPSRLVALAPGASRNTKRWPAERWQELAGMLDARQIRVAWCGTAAEKNLAGEAPGIRTFGYPLRKSAALLKLASAVVANDSGPMHLATAVGTPVVAMFGPTVRQFGFAPYSKNAIVVERSVGCRPCSAYGSKKCPLGHHRCMKEIDPAEILGRIEETLT